MTQIDDETLRGLQSAITPGPWDYDGNGQILSKTTWHENGLTHHDFRYPNIIGQVTDNLDQSPNARAIALVPDLLATHIAERALAGQLADALHHMVNASVHPDQMADDALAAYHAARGKIGGAV